MHPHLKRALDEIESAAGSLTVPVLTRRHGDKWSVAEILEHLTLAFTLNRTVLDHALESGEVKVRTPRLLQRLGRVLVVDVGYFPRVQAPDGTRPRGSIPAERSVSAVRDALAALDGTLARADVRFGSSRRVANHPYFAGLTVPQWRKFHMQHTRHHMRQVRTRATE